MSLPPSLPQSRPHGGQTARASHFEQEIAERAQRATASVERATAEGEDYLAEVHLAELESLLRLASEHDVELPAAREFLHRHTRVIDLTGVEDRAGAPACGA
ncbi:hypothetical protein NUM3379_06960 [Kineococcus sp. NUM-3379]